MRRALQRFGGDAAARLKLGSERKRLLKAMKDATATTESRSVIHAKLVRLRADLRAVRTQIQFVEPKSVRSRRTIALPAMVVKALRRHRVRQLQARLLAGERWQETGLVFTTSIGTPMDGRNVTREFRALLAVLKLPTLRVHDLRHSCATLLLVQGVSPRVVMETLGHSQVSLTLNTYSHVLPALQEDAASRMDEILAPAR